MTDELEILEVKLEVDDKDLDTLGMKLEEVEADFKRFGAKRYKATVDADTKKAQRNIEELRLELKRLEEEEKKERAINAASSAQAQSASTKRLKALAAERAATKQAVADEQRRVVASKRLSDEVQRLGKMEDIAAANRAKASKQAEVADKAREQAAQAASKAAQAREKAVLDAVHAEQRARATAAKEAQQEASAQARAEAAQAKAEAARAKVEAAAAAAHKKQSADALAAMERETRAAAAGADAESKHASQRQSDLRKEAQMQADAAAMDAKIEAARAAGDLREAQNLRQIASLQHQYAQAQKQSAALTSASRRAQGSEKVRVEIDQTRALAQMEELRAKLKLMNVEPIDIKAQTTTKDRALRFFTGASDLSTAQRLKGVLSDLSKAAKDGRVNILGMSMSVGGLVVGLAALAPVVTGLIGALGALVAVVGSGLLGALGVAGAALGGFTMAGLGMFAMLKPAVSQFLQVRTAAKAVTTAINKYGQGSKQAAQAQHNLNSVMANASPAVRTAVKDWTDLSKQWHGLTDKASQRDFGQIMSSSLGVAKVAMKSFATDSVHSLDAVSAGWKSWMQDLASPQAQADFNNIFGNFNKSIPNIMSGLQHLGDAFRRIFSTFSNFMPGLTHGFDNWAKGIDDATKNGSKLESTAHTMVNSLRDVGHFAESAGRFLAAFFKAGVGPGNGMLNDMTNSLNKVTKAMSSVSGQKRLTDFFSRSVGTTKQLWNALVPLIKAFTNLGSALRPVSTIALGIVSAFSEILAFLIAAKPLQYVLGAIFGGAILGRAATSIGSLAKDFGSLVKNMWTFVAGMGKLGVVGSFKNAFGGPTTGVAIGESAAETMLAAAPEIGAAIGAAAAPEMAAGGAAAGAVGLTEGAGLAAIDGGAAVGGAAATDAAMAESTLAIGATDTAAVGLGATLTGLAGPLAIVAAGGLAIYAAFKLFGGGEDAITSNTANVNAQLKRQGELLVGIHRALSNSTTAGIALAETHASLASSTHDLNTLSAKLNMLQLQGRTNTAKYRDTLQEFNQKLQEQQDLQKQWTKGTKDQLKATESASQAISGNYNKAMLNQATALKNVNKAQSAYNSDVKSFGKNSAVAQGALANLKRAQNEYAHATDAATVAGIHMQRVEHDLLIQHMNLAREAHNLAPIMTEALGNFGGVTERAGAAIGSLVERMRAAGQIKGINFLMKLPDPRQIVQITKLIDGLRSQGDVKKSFSILGDSKSATDAIKAINALSVNEKKVSVQANVAGALNELRKLDAQPLQPKTLLLHGDARDAQNKINLINKLTVTAKILALLGNPAGAFTAHSEVQALSDIAKTLTIGGDNSAALAAIGAVESALAAIHSVTVALNVVKHGPATGLSVLADGGTNAAPKGFSNDPILRNKQRRAAVEAARRPTGRTRAGGMFGKPTYLVGEENRPEFVIATNPAYRKANVGYLADAAHQFGMRLTTAATGMGADKAKKKKPKPATPIVRDPHAGSLGEAGKKQDSKNPKRNKPNHPTPPGLPAQDRIGGVGTADIDAAVAAAQTAYDTKKQNLASARVQNSKKKSVPKYSAKQIADQTKGLKDKLDGLKAFDAKANAAIQRFTNVETQITATESYMTTANAAPDDKAQGYNEKGRLITATWPQWLVQLQDLEKQHTSLLNAAVRDAKNRIGKNPNAKNLGYVRTLEAALGQSIVDTNAADTETQTAIAPTAFTLDDYIAKQGLTDNLGKLQYEYAAAQIGNVADDPGTPQREDVASLQDDQTAAGKLLTFYTNLFSAAKKDQPKNYGLLTEAATDVSQAQSTYQGILDQINAAGAATGPLQSQLASSALYSMFQNYGSNVGNALLINSPQVAATGFDPFEGMAGGASAAATLAPGSGSGSGGGAGMTHTDNSRTAHVTNHYMMPPSDPHSWSKGLSWELEHAL